MRLPALLVTLALPLVVISNAHAAISVNAKSAILLDANSGKVLYKKNDTDQRAVASTQKLLTALIVAESGDLDKKVTIELSDTQCEPFKLYIKPGQTYTRRELLHALMIRSSNDVARALARDNAGSIEAFARKMTRRVQELGGTGSNFINPNGLPASGQYSTARDMARVARMAYRNPTLRQIMNTKNYDFRFSTGKVVPLRNNGRDVIAVVLGSTKGVVATESAKLLAYGLQMSPSQVDKTRLASN